CAALLFSIPTPLLERASGPLLALAIALLGLVLIPGLGHAVNGSRRWLKLAGVNFQVSELSRMLVLVYLASYAVRREAELRESFTGLGKPLVLLAGASALLLAEPDFGAATVLFATGFALLFLAGARLRYVIATTALAGAGFAVLAVSSSYRLRRLTAFLDPWADPYNSGFQLTQSLIAIGRGQWLGVGLGDSVQKLFYLPEAHTDFLFAVLAEELGLAGVALTLALFLGLIWRSFHIARLASDAHLRFQSLLAAGFGLWVGIQAFINIGVNMGVLPTKGLTLPLMSYGRSSLVVALAWVGLGLRGKGILAWVGAPIRLTLALIQALRVMWRYRPVVVVGLGGFVTGPGGLAAWLTRRPLLIHEQNAIAGFTNRILAHLARQVLEG